MKGLTEEEKEILKHTNDIWNTFMDMKQTHPDDQRNLLDAVHNIQYIIGMRLARREAPETFKTIKE